MHDFLIIGGGIAGLSAGARLAGLGATLLVEGEAQLGYHTSGRSAALYEAEYGAPPTVALARASGEELAEMGVLSPRGLLAVGQAHERAAFDKDCADLHLTRITPAEAEAIVPILNLARVAYAAQTDGAQNIDTDLMLQTYARRLRERGGEIRTGAAVAAIRRDADGWTVTLSDREELRARRLVNAAGAWADRIAALAGLPGIGLQPYRRSMAQLPAPEGHDIRAWPLLFGVGETWYAKPEAGKLLVSPAEADPAEPHDAWADDMVLAEGLARYEEMVTVPVTRVEASWAGLRSFVPDRTLVLGPDPLDADFLWCAGQGGQGFQSAPGAARVMEEVAGGAASGIAPEILAALSPARLR
ncbi:FAD-dependent oxidoreductase [Pararhodobacter sp. SW119]|uniref:NAD(P)/FAD-dependent oxidoreductase n=1 Tax=Pararhodobacter sp. SW119 TaxID=2780075 RepID=UPI001AE01BBA|nr:FAD-dependent oxidoreductase [Pararhodobacter sp. SW119]